MNSNWELLALNQTEENLDKILYDSLDIQKLQSLKKEKIFNKETKL